ncbi:MAG: hypothetical protein H6Q41_3956 [Deltaproteobacteria bacterium]|jgi:hypothetical protein|nr:hypothetical protein [Deltaproteobacteria bacterium]
MFAPFHFFEPFVRLNANLKNLEEAQMNCPRCQGVMAFEKFYGPHENFFGWRCIYCGEIVDQVILDNRGWH